MAQIPRSKSAGAVLHSKAQLLIELFFPKILLAFANGLCYEVRRNSAGLIASPLAARFEAGFAMKRLTQNGVCDEEQKV